MNLLLSQLNLSGVQTRPPQQKGEPRYLLSHLEGDDYVLEIDWSSIQQALTCDRSAMWSLIYGRTTGKSAALTYGSAIHKGLETYYRGGASLTEILASGEQEFLDYPPGLSEWRTYDSYARALTEYVKKYSIEDTFTILRNSEDLPMVEQGFALPLTVIPVGEFLAFPGELICKNPPAVIERAAPSDFAGGLNLFVDNIHVVWTGVIDLVVKDSDQLWIVDHKTTSIEGDSYWKQYELSQQFTGYVWAASELLGQRVEGAVANVIYGRQPTKTGRGLDFLRRRYHYRDDQLGEWRQNMIWLMEDFVHNLQTGRFPMKTQWCVGKFGTCPYHDVCSLPSSARLTMLMSDQYSRNVWNPLT